MTTSSSVQPAGAASTQHTTVQKNITYAVERKTLGAFIPAHIKHYVCDGKLVEWTGDVQTVTSPAFANADDAPVALGSFPMLGEKESLACLDASVKAFDYGRGAWPKATPATRIAAVEKFVAGMEKVRDRMVELIQWEIAKNPADAAKEIDRTILYIKNTLDVYKKTINSESTFLRDSGVVAQCRRAPYGVVLCVGPSNYPINETYTTLIPAILMGNTVMLKVPRIGALCHEPTFKLFASCFPKGVVNIMSGSGRVSLGPIMKTGKVDILAFIGGSTAADELVKQHPKPHRLRMCLSLEAKNAAIILPDANLDNAAKVCTAGAFSYNGQRCTAIKLIFVHSSIKDAFIKKYIESVDSLQIGMPFDPVNITPLPNMRKVEYMQALVDDALAKGGKVANARGNRRQRTVFTPTVITDVTRDMRIFQEEQFGPVSPVCVFDDVSEVYEHLARCDYGQQASVFGEDPATVGSLCDVLTNLVARVNLNQQCQRGPDTFPFAGRKGSANGTLSVADALRVFSIRSMVATSGDNNVALVDDVVNTRTSNFLRLEYLF